MKHPFLRWLILLFSLLTATSHATHLKGGSVSWEPVSSTATTFTVKAKIQLNYDLSDEGITGATGPLVKGKRVYQKDDLVTVSVGNTKLYWGDEDPGDPVLELEGVPNGFKVVKVDEAAQIITVEPVSANPNDLVHEYTGSMGDLFTLNLQANARDNEEVLNRGGTMRLESTVKLQPGASQPNRPPVFDFKEKQAPAVTIPLPVVVTRSGTASFDVPVAVDPDNATTPTDIITYRFVNEESEATQGSTEEDPWEKQGDNQPTIAYDAVAGKWKITWDTSDYDQTIHTFAFQVVAEDRPISDPTGPAKSKATIEFQVWVNDPNQDGTPEIALLPNFTSFTATVGQPMEFRIIGTDRDSGGNLENSRLVVVTGAGEMPVGAVITPAGGFVGEAGGHHGEGDHMEGVFSWTPQASDVGTQKILNLRIQDDDGNLSPVKTVTINVFGGSGPQPLELTVTPSTVEEDNLSVTVLPDVPMSLTVAATCASFGVPLQLYMEGELPEDAVMTPALPVSGNSNAQSTFTWTPGGDDITSFGNAHEVTFIAGDSHGREILKTLRIYVLPALPTIVLAPGEPNSLSSEPWKAESVDFIATGGYGSNTWLDLEVLGAGSLDSSYVESGERSTLKWRVLPGLPTPGMLRVQARDSFGQTAILEVPYTVTYPAVAAPQWWVDRNVVTGGAVSDFGMANQGQLKAITKAAYDAIKAEYPDLDTATLEGADLANFVNGFSPTTGNYSPVTQGQVKNAANLVYRAIEAVTGKQGLGVAWTDTWEDDQSNAPAAVGQIKTLFSFPTPIAGLFNDPPEVAITSPAAGSVFNSRNVVTFTASANDPDGIASVKFYVGENLIVTDTTSPYSFTSGFSNGNFLIKAEATDNRGAVSETTIPITVYQWINTPPTVSITSPTSSSFPSPAYFSTVAATAGDVDGPIEKVTFYLNDTVIGEDYSSPYSVSMSQMIIAPGSHQFKAKARDLDGGETTTTFSFNVTMPSGNNSATIVLQDGLNDYLGTADTYIRGDSPTYKGATANLEMDNSPAKSALVRWDTSMIPTNAIVTEVTLGFYVVPNGETLRDFTIYKVVRDWSEADANWTQATAIQNWGTAGAKNITTNPDREDVNLATLSGEGDNAPISAYYSDNGVQMRAVVQQWINNPSTNKGIAIQHRASSVAVHPLILHPSEDPTVTKRPKLTIKYRFP